MSEGAWFDRLTRALARDGDRRGFLRLLAGGIAGMALGGLSSSRQGEAAPAAQVMCNPRPPVVITPTPGFDQITVVVRATGQGNTVKKVTFNGLRNAVVDVAGVATGAGNGFFYEPPAGATQTTFSVRAVNGSGDVHAPFVVLDGCSSPWSSFVGAGPGTLRNTALVCTSGATTLTAPAPAGTTTLQVANQSCFKVGDSITLDPGGSGQETLVVAGFGSVITSGPTSRAHPAGTPVFRRPGIGDMCETGHLFDPCASTGASCCQADGQPTGLGVCCPFGYCCDTIDGILGNDDAVCVDDSAYASDMKNCGSCGHFCDPEKADRCVNGVCRCGGSPACANGECLRGACCNSPNVVCGRSTNLQCCNGTTHYCTEIGDGPDSICCENDRVACGSTCCPRTHYCGGGRCTPCPYQADRFDRTSGACRCGAGGLCDAGHGFECEGGTCVCAASPGGNKLGKYVSTYDSNLNVWTRDIHECPAGDKICKKVDPSFPEPFFPEYSCAGSCSHPYEEIEPLCTRP